MENRRPTASNSPRPPSSNRTSNFKREGDNRPYGANRPPQQARDNRFQPRGSSNDRFQNRDNRQQSGDGRFQGGGGRDDRNQGRSGGGKFQPRSNNKFQPRGRFAPKGKGYKPWRKENLIRIVSDMQVTDGKHRGKYMETTKSERVRPTARRIREVMFRILYRRIRAGRFLDLCAGSGTVGIEAISRGAMIGTFVERSAKMCGFIKKNMASIGIKEGHGEIHEIEVIPFLKKMSKRRRFWDVVYFDPPYDSDYETVLAYFSRGVCIKPKGVLIVEHQTEKEMAEKIGVMHRWRVVTQGETSLSFYERKES